MDLWAAILLSTAVLGFSLVAAVWIVVLIHERIESPDNLLQPIDLEWTDKRVGALIDEADAAHKRIAELEAALRRIASGTDADASIAAEALQRRIE